MKKVALMAGILLFAVLSIITFQQYEKFRWRKRVYVINCSLFDFQMKPLLNMPGTMCVFLKNGDVVRYFDDSQELNLIAKTGKVKWTARPYIAHHAMKADRSQSRLYFLSIENKDYQGHLIKFDKIIALDLKTGKEMNSWSFYSMAGELEKEMGSPLKQDQCVPYGKNQDVTHEVSHFNSINLIPEKFSSDMEVIVNSGRGFQLFFTKDLIPAGKFTYNHRWMADSHDAQITEEGNLLLYRNFGDEHPDSFLEMRSLIDNKVLWSYTGPGRTFRADLFGSVQLFSDGSFLYSDMKNGGHFTTVSVKGTVLNDFYYPEIDPRTKLPATFHTIRRLEYEELSHEVQQQLKKEIGQTLLSKFFLFLCCLPS